nr:EpsG family protein [Lysinibacillus timonensis]
MIYAIIFGIIVIAALVNILTNYKHKSLVNIYFIIISLFMLFIAAFRDGIGYDYANYKKLFDLIHYRDASSSEVNIELGFYAIMKLFTNNYLVVFFTATISILLKVIYIDRYSKDKIISLLLYFSGVFIMFDMGVIRQGLSIGITLLSIKHIKERSFTKFLFIICFAALFHVSAIIFLPLYFLGNKSFSRKTYYFITLVVLIISFADLTKLIVNLLMYIPIGIIQSKLMWYSSLETGELATSLIKRVLFLVLFIEYFKVKKISDSDSYIYLNGYFLSIVIMGLFSSIDIIGGRGSTGLYFLQIFIFAIVMKSMSHIYLRFLMLILVILLSVNSITGPINDGSTSNQPYLPYENILLKLFGG